MNNVIGLLSPHSVRGARQVLETLKKRRTIVFGSAGALLIIIISSGAYAAMRVHDTPALNQTSGQESEKDLDTLTTIAPELVSDSSSVILLGTILSHETANIYPRRSGIVEDIYVDIGDHVEKGQVVALLLPQGVEGLSAAKIAEKQARKSEAESNLSTATQVAEETIISTRQKINEKETELMIAQREQDSLLQKFAESEGNIMQKHEQAFTTVQHTRQLIEWILLGSNSRSGVHMRSDDLLKNLGIQDSSNTYRYSIVEAFNTLTDTEREYINASDFQKPVVIDRMLAQALDALHVTNMLLQYTPSEITANGFDRLTHAQLTERIGKITTVQDNVYSSKEKLEDARFSFQTLASSEPELFAAFRSGQYEGLKSNKVRMLEEHIRSANNTLGLTEANQQQIVERQKSMVDIANTMLQSEYAESGHRKILSPFSGTVSKRFLHVGQIVSPSMPAFEMTDVLTSLAKKAKAEVQFGLPEHLLDAVDIGDQIAFFLQEDEGEEYSAEITRKSPQVDMKTHTVTVQAKIPDDLQLPHQSSVRIRLTDNKKPIYRVPSSAVKREEDQNYIWLLDPETHEPLQLVVSVSAEDGEFAEITGILTKESAIILDPPDLFND